MVLQQQIEALIEYLESHREMANACFGRSKEGREQSRKLWNELALFVNTKGPNPDIKTGNGWRLYYNEYKYKCLKKIKFLKEEHINASGPTKRIMLTPTQNRLYNILGPDAQDPLIVRQDVKKPQDNPRIHKDFSIPERNGQEPLPGVRIDPLFHEETLPTSQCVEDSIDITTPPLQSPTASSPPASPPPASPPPVSSPPPESALERLVRVKEMKTEAILAQARATDRLAAAIERGIERLNQPLVIALRTSTKKRKRQGSVETSDSESE